MDDAFRIGWPELKAIAIAVVIISVWAVVRYRWFELGSPAGPRPR